MLCCQFPQSFARIDGRGTNMRKICPAVDRVRAGVSGVMEMFFLRSNHALGNEDPKQQVVSLGEVGGAFQAEGIV